MFIRSMQVMGQNFILNMYTITFLWLYVVSGTYEKQRRPWVHSKNSLLGLNDS
jgi:hypothetical protein